MKKIGSHCIKRWAHVTPTRDNKIFYNCRAVAHWNLTFKKTSEKLKRNRPKTENRHADLPEKILACRPGQKEIQTLIFREFLLFTVRIRNASDSRPTLPVLICGEGVYCLELNWGLEKLLSRVAVTWAQRLIQWEPTFPLTDVSWVKNNSNLT